MSVLVFHASPLSAQFRADVTSLNELPAESRALIERQKPPAAHQKLTPVLVTIDPLGAVGDVAWTVHYATLNVRTEPSTTMGSVVGSLVQNDTVIGDYYLVIESDEEWLQIQFGGQPRWISRTGVTRIHPTNQANITAFTNLPIGSELVNRWWGIPMSYEANDIVTLPVGYRSGTQRLRSEPAAAIVALIDAGRLAGVNLIVGSSYRSGPTQQSIYNNAVNNDGLSQRYSAPPGHSEHQLGTTVDLTDTSTGNFVTSGSIAHNWLLAHSAAFGFTQSYTATNIAETGYIEEPWHLRYRSLSSQEGWELY